MDTGDIVVAVVASVFLSMFAIGIIVDIFHETSYDYWDYERVYPIDEVADALVSGEIDSVMVTDSDSPIPKGKMIFIPFDNF